MIISYESKKKKSSKKSPDRGCVERSSITAEVLDAKLTGSQLYTALRLWLRLLNEKIVLISIGCGGWRKLRTLCLG